MDNRRVVEIILDEAAKLPERYPGYSKDLQEVVADIVQLERQHKHMSRNIKQDVAAQVNNLGNDIESKSRAE